MSKLLPQEIESRYLIPAIRKALVHHWIEDGMSQRNAAQLLDITEAAVSQYLKEKRGSDMKFNAKEKSLLKDAADRIKATPEDAMKIIYTASVKLRGAEGLCQLHKTHDHDLPEKCRICLDEK
ncbi:hypothetical protein H6504_05730 [Candidatus Woesearchaeota archaeon]|nr:hypothetical protein [Candidatus Woesearchaeota archaeon]